ncbi:Snf7-domain-containing protein [Suillus fuscotomentosus]|uniref:Vacuolar-sorting protein SNF7 n=1 Tax=Suillus fuscotomentosus TaxID=1912939 RepID=A0AAD4HSD6_9AGAM|nr:Snf7-domain-containing protein [Suillus fuscotomentosus]KAG1907258.1 Snf7-domain-containing protein [Suillus fuscotomentosus]
MAGIMSYFGGRRDTKQAARDAIVGLRQQLQMIEKKEEHLQKKIDEELKKAKANAVSNKAVATQALRRKKASESEMDRLAGQRLQLELQINTLESANLNAETMAAMKKASDVLASIHGNMTMDKVDSTMSKITEQREIATEIAEALSYPTGTEADEDDLKAELAELEQETLDERLAGAEHVPLHIPAGARRVEERRKTPQINFTFNQLTSYAAAVVVEDDEEAQLRELQAALAM